MSFFPSFLKKKHTLNILILIAVSLLSYINVYHNEFISDDISGIVNNPEIANLKSSLISLSSVNIINSIIYLLFGPNPVPFHLINNLLHVANVLLVYTLLNVIEDKEKFLSAKKLALPVSVIFAVIPLHTEAVTWISGKPYTLYTLFVLVSLIAFILHTKKPNNSLLFLSLVSFVISLYTSEKAIITPLMTLLYLATFKSIKKYLPSLALLVLSSIPYCLSLTTKIPQRIDAVSSYSGLVAIHNPLFQIPTAISTYIELFLLPINLTLYHTFLYSAPEITLKYAISIFFLLLTIVSYKRSGLVFFAAGFYLISILPTLIPINVGWIVAERYSYLGSLGLTIIFVYLIYKTIYKFTKSAQAPKATLSVITLIFLAVTLIRNNQWLNQDTFWPVTLEKSPYAPIAHNNMGDYYFRHNDLSKAKEEFNKSIELGNGYYPDGIHNLANIYLIEKDYDKATSLYKKAISQNPYLVESYLQLVLVSLKQNNIREAQNWINKALKIPPIDLGTAHNLSIIKTLKGTVDQVNQYGNDIKKP